MNKTRMGKRGASLLLSLVMMLSLLPTAAYATMADGAETQDAIVSGNGTGVSDDSNSSGNTDDLQVGDSKDSDGTGDQQVEGSNGSGTADDTTGTEGGADPTDSVNGNDSADPQDDGDAVLPAAANVAKVGDTEYATLEAAIAALGSSSYTLELLDESVWEAATPVYWAAGSESGYAATLAEALTAAYKANAGAITIVCRPGADVGELTHGHVADDITIYGNNAYISGGECDLEVDTYTFSRDTGKQVEAGGAYLEKDITVTAYELDNLGVWGQRHTDHKVTVNLTDCDSTDGITVQRVYISGTTGVNDITLTGCDFGTKATSVYSNADGAVVIDNCSFTGAQVPVNFNHKANGTQTVAVQNSTFTNCGDNGDWKQFAAPVRFVNSGSGTMDTTVNTCTFTDTVGSNGDILLGDGRVDQNSNDVALTVESTKATVQAQQPGYYGKDGTTDESKQGTKNVAAGDKLTTSVTQLMPSETPTYVAEVNGIQYETLQAAIDAAAKNATVTLLADTRENVTISTYGLTLDLNGHTLNGGTVAGKPALTVKNRVTVKDSSAAQTGTIMREDTAENSGVSSHYVIDIQDGWLFFESGSVTNNSGVVGVKGASLVRVGDDSVAKYPGLTISGGTFTQDNFIVIKVDRGTFYLKEDGTLNSKNSYAVENWKFAEIKGGTVNGTVAAWTYSGGHNSDLTISGGTVNGNVLSVNYGSAEGKVAKVSITGGTVNGALDTRSYDPSTNELTSIDDATKATIKVTGGTFKEDPSKYVVENSGVTPNGDGTFGVAKAYLAKVGDTSYYTMDEAFKAQTASGEPIVLLRDYTTGSAFSSGSIDRTVDLAGHTWTCTGTDANSAAFEINYSDVTLTVKNGKVVSSQLVGLIPSAMGGTIKYDNSSLEFDGVVMTTTAHSGIETNGNNTNDTVKLVNSELNVPNGFGIYFPSSGTLTIDNSVINAQTMGVQVCAGSLNISGAKTAITVSGDGIPKTINDGAIEDGAAISIVNRTGYKGLDEIKVEGGTFTANGTNAAVKAYDWDNTNKTESDFTQAAKVSVSGGTFSSEVDKSLCADGYIPTQNADGTYGVKEGADGYVEDENGNVTISTAEGLFYFAKKVNAGNNFAGKTVTLANNIDLNNEKWTPIGIYGTQATWFKGTFDGQNHAVTGLKVEESRKNGVGFFSKVYTGTIKNLTVEGSVSAPGCTYVGGIVGHGYATITNCTFKGTVSGSGAAQVGGIAGSGGFTVDRCSVYGDVSAGCWAGGIVGNCQDGGAYTNCYVEGTISSESTFWGGGAAGITPVPLYPSQVISGCYSNTVVKVAGEEVNCPIIACYNNPLDHDGYSGGLKIYDNSWNKQKNSNDSYPIYAEKDGKGGVLMEGMTAARDNSLIMLEDDLNYVTGDLSKVRIMAGSSVTQAQIDALAVASVGDSKYKSLTEAIDAAQDGQTVTLLADVEQNAQLTIDKSITLDLNGKTIKISGYTAEKAQVSVKGNLTIQDSSEAQTGKICSDYTGTAGRVVSVENGGKLTIAGGTITTEGMSGLSGSAVYIASGAEVNMTGGAVKVDAKRGNVAMNVKGSTGVFTMSGGSVIAEAGDGTETYITAISGSSGSTIQISAGTVSGPQALLAGSSATTITGGNFTGSITVKNGSISGGTFDRALDKKACAAGYVPTQNGDGTYGVEIGMFTVMVTSRTTGSNSPVANVTGGGSDITYAVGTKVTASAISGYKFVGWFVNEYTGTPYSTDLTCEVKPTADCTMIAVYEPISGGMFWLTVTASEFTVNGGATQRSYLPEKMPVGTQVTVVFKGSENFLYWVNESGKVVSTSKTYAFSMGSATTLKAVYAEKEENQAMVVFISHTQQVISSKSYTDTQKIQFPEPPIKMGATFVRWSMTEAEICAAMATTATGIIVVEPVYEFNAGSYTVTVNYPNDETATYTATVGKITPVTAKSIDGKVFKCWKNGDTVLGYTETLKIAPRGDLTLTAEYVDAGTTVDRLPVIALTEISASQQGAKYAVSFTATRSVPDGYTVTEQGVLVSTDSRYGEAGALDAMKLDADGDEPDNTKSLKATNTDATGVTVLNGIVSAADRTVYGRAYMILRDSSGTMVYVYSDTILSGSYNSLTTNGGN